MLPWRMLRPFHAWGRVRCLVLLGGLFVLAGCGDEEPATSDIGRACDLFATQVEVALPPPAVGNATMGLGEAITTTRRRGPAFDVSLYLQPGRSAELNNVAAEVGELSGIEVVAVLDQADVYDEFVAIFEGNEQLISAVTPDVLPPAVRVTVPSDANFEGLEAAFSDDERIYHIVDEYGLKAGSIDSIARRLPTELAELEGITNGELREAIAVIRSDNKPSRSELPRSVVAIQDFLDHECDASS